MKRELANYEIFPKMIESGRKTSITIRPLGKHAEFKPDTEYQITFLPMCESISSMDIEYDSVVLKSQDGSLSFEHEFPGEQAHIVRVFKLPLTDTDKPVGNFMIYSLLSDLYTVRPYRGDFHVHTCRSNGKEAPDIVAMLISL